MKFFFFFFCSKPWRQGRQITLQNMLFSLSISAVVSSVKGVLGRALHLFKKLFKFWLIISGEVFFSEYQSEFFFLTILLGDGYCWKLSWRCVDTRAIEQASHMVWYLLWTLQQASMEMRSSFLLAFSRREFVLTEDIPYFLKRRRLCQSPISNNPVLI